MGARVHLGRGHGGSQRTSLGCSLALGPWLGGRGLNWAHPSQLITLQPRGSWSPPLGPSAAFCWKPRDRALDEGCGPRCCELQANQKDQ